MRHREFQGERRGALLLNPGLTAQPLDCPSNPLNQPKPPRCQRQAVPADGGVLAGHVHRAPDGAAVPFRHAVGKLRNPKRIPRRSKAAEHVAVLVARLGG